MNYKEDVIDELDDLLAEQSADPEFVQRYEDVSERKNCLVELVAERGRQGVSQDVIAKMMGTTQSAVSELEGGASEPQLATLQKYARALGFRLRLRVERPANASFIELAISRPGRVTVSSAAWVVCHSASRTVGSLATTVQLVR